MSVWIECLGGFALTSGGAPVTLTARKAQIMLGLLVAARRHRLPRARLAALLWEHADDASARSSLRQAVAQLRRAAGEGIIVADGDALRLGPDCGSDLGAFSEALARGDDAEAGRLYAGPFLDGTLPDGADLAAAVEAERARLSGLAEDALRREIARAGDGPEGVQAAHRLLALDPLDEAAHRRLMIAEAARGGRGAARARFNTLRDALRRDLGAEPEAETSALMARLHGARETAADGAAPSPPAVAAPVEPSLLLSALEAAEGADWDRFAAAVTDAGGRMLDCGAGEGAAIWSDAPLRAVASAAREMAKDASDTLSFGLVEAADGTARDLARARRVAARAEPGEVHVDPDLAPRLGLVAKDGTPVPLRLGGSQARPGLPLVGRSLEVAQVESALGAARTGSTGLAIHICGEAGIGKSRLLQEIAQREADRGARVIEVGFEPLARSGQHIAQDLASRLPPLPEAEIADDTTRALLSWLRGEALRPDADLRLTALGGTARHGRMVDLVARAMIHAGGTAPLLVAIEDAHWAPPGIGDFLLDLADRLGAANVALVLTERPHGADLGRRLAARARIGLVRLALGPLAPPEAARLAELAAPAQARDPAVLDRAAGHPLFLLRLLEAGWRSGALPNSVTGLVMEQIEGLPPADRAALRFASILGPVFDPAEARAVFPDMPAPRPVGDLLHAADAGLAFGHDLVRQAIYHSIPPETRLDWHGRAAAHHRGGDAVRWAHHALLAGDDAEACRAATAAANEMIGQMRMGVAGTYIEAGLERGGDPEAVAELHSCRAGIRRMRGDLHGALEDYRAAHAAAIVDTTRVAMLVRRALILHRLGEGDAADRALDDAEAIAARIGLAGIGRAEIHEQRGNRAFVAGDAEACLAEHVAGLAAAEMSGNPRGIARAHGGLGDAHVLSGRLRTAFGHFERAVDLARDGGMGLTHQEYAFMRGYTLHFAEPGPKAHLLADLAVESAVESGAARTEMMARDVRAEIRLMASDLDAAREDIARVAALTEADPESRVVADVAMMNGWLALREGDPDRAFLTLEPLFSAARQSPYNGPTILALGALAAPDAATRHDLLDAAGARVRTGAMGPVAIEFHCFALEVAAREDDAEAARRHVAALHAFASQEPLGLVDLAIRVAALRFGPEASAEAEADLRAELDRARLAGLALILSREAR
ncbi:AAA family ATPase [uncultured Jannaschia sp.]|uniref:AAA family ATPase n=1 Tax=uncultured Jannaschia sp. TaxID=293347 RepID=UPI00260A2EBE|nr:AAA family ATPase [uncultured Jannaschia sp.]